MTLTKSQIVDYLWNETKIPKQKCGQIVETLFETVKRTLESGEGLLVTGFGKWSVREDTDGLWKLCLVPIHYRMYLI